MITMVLFVFDLTNAGTSLHEEMASIFSDLDEEASPLQGSTWPIGNVLKLARRVLDWVIANIRVEKFRRRKLWTIASIFAGDIETEAGRMFERVPYSGWIP